jgi:hypothetical protein
MNKYVALTATALLTVGFAAASMAADVPKSAGPVAADTPSTTSPSKTSHKHKKHKKTNPAPTSAQ